MTTTAGTVIQAVEWQKGKIGVSSGDFKDVTVLHCNEDGDVTAKFPSGDETASFKAGDDVALDRVDVTIVSGKFTVN